MKKFIDFIITQNCSYNCSYCSQNKSLMKHKNSATSETIENFLLLLDKIEKDFEITITGGEALLHPEFFTLIEKVKNKGFKINLITNFSFTFEKYQKIFEILENSLNEFAISFHLEQIQNFNLILSKLQKLFELKPKEAKFQFFIPICNLSAKKEEKIQKIVDFAKKNNIAYEFQQIRILNKHKKINKNEKKYLQNDKIFKSFGKKCYAGSLSAVVYEDGEAYSCYSSRFLKTNYLGNINNPDFSLRNEPIYCPLMLCTCPKPRVCGQITEEEDKKISLKNMLKNLIFLPYFILKRRQVVVLKLKQILK